MVKGVKTRKEKTNKMIRGNNQMQNLEGCIEGLVLGCSLGCELGRVEGCCDGCTV